LVTLQVATPGSIEFGGPIVEEEGEKWMLVEDQEASFQCISRGGNPMPEVTGYLDDVEPSDVDTIQNEEDGTWEVEKEYTFVPSRDDCGKEVKCVVSQLNEDGELIFGEQLEISKKIMVIYPPQPAEPVTAGFNEETGDPVEITIEFMAHPTPAADQVTWQLGDEELAPGDSTDNWEAAELEVDGHTVRATLTILTFTEEQAEESHSLLVANGVGESREYPFTVVFNAKPIPTTTTTTTTTTATTTTTEPAEQWVYKPFATLRPAAAAMGGGSIAAIILLTICLVGGLLLVVYMKKQRMACFNEPRSYEEVARVAPDAETGGKPQTPIVKK